MGQIVAAMATVHAPQLYTRPPSEDMAQLDADIVAMRELGKSLDETKPDAVIVIGSDHLETFFLSSVPTFAVLSGERSHAAFNRKEYNLPIHQGLSEDLLDKLVRADFDMSYSQDAILGHSFSAVYEWVLEGRDIPVVPIFINAYLPPLPSPRRCEALGREIAKVIASRKERVAIVASGGMSHFPGTWKYPQPAFDFDYWAIAQMERGNHKALLDLTVEQLDEVGNTEMLSWMALFGAIGNVPGELITYQPTWHHGHAVMRFLPDKRTKGANGDSKIPPAYQFTDSGGYMFYKHPSPSAYKLNKLLYELRHKQDLRLRLLKNTPEVTAEYGLNSEETAAVEKMKDESIDVLRSLKSHPLVDVGAHPLGMWMSIVVVQAEARRLRAEAAKQKSS
jgi:aromatic ring-opening dioxygenase catalytic subunit (LigB family)